MIYTLTLNTSIDYNIRLKSPIRVGEVNRSAEEYMTAGGKGVACAVMLSRLGQDVTALGFVGGTTGEFVKETLMNQGVSCMLTRTASPTRINVKAMYDTVTEINCAGEGIRAEEVQAVMKTLDNVSKGDFLTLSGSIPPGVDENIYGEIMKTALAENIPVILDAPGKIVRKCLKYRPFLVKPNTSELEDVFDEPVRGIKAIAEKARELCKMGANSALVSMGGDGALLCAEDGKIYACSAVPVEVQSAVGCGDSMVAGYLSAYIDSGDPVTSLRLAVAAGSATAASRSLATAEEVERLFEFTRGTVRKYTEEK